MSLKNKNSKPVKKVAEKLKQKPLKESYDVKLSAASINRISILINLAEQNGSGSVKDANGNHVCTLAEVAVDLKRELAPQIK